jgi:hypothetical protein
MPHTTAPLVPPPSAIKFNLLLQFSKRFPPSIPPIDQALDKYVYIQIDLNVVVYIILHRLYIYSFVYVDG